MDKYGDDHILVVVDMQNDFVGGSLGSGSAEAIVPNVVELMGMFEPGNVYATMDTHGPDYLSRTLEGARLPVEHCIKGTEGWELVAPVGEFFDRLAREHEERHGFLPPYRHVIEKGTFGSTELLDELDERAGCTFWPAEGPTVHLCGLCTDICVVTNALLLRTLFPNARVICHANCCAGTSKAAHDAALAVMRSCQIDIEGA